MAAQQVKEPKYKPTEIQFLRLQVRQRDTKLAQIQLGVAMNEFRAEAAKVATENGWPDDLIFNGEDLMFIDPPVAVPSQKESVKP